MKTIIYAVMLIITVCSCKKFIEVKAPATTTNGNNVYSSDDNAAAVLTGIYANMSARGVRGGLNAVSLFGGLSADELTLSGGTANLVADYVPYYTNGLSNSNTGVDFNNYIYPVIFTANAAIEGLTAADHLTPAVKQQLLGEAKFIRGFCYFYLVNLFGDVPLATGTDYQQNAALKRTPKEQVYKLIIDDLVQAKDLLSETYLSGNAVTPSGDRVRPTKWAAAALLARVYLYTGDWAAAETQATEVISNTGLFNLNSADDIFRSNSNEAIWQLQSVNENENTPEAKLFVLPETGPTASFDYPVYLSAHVVNAFEPGDERRVKWIDSVVVDNITYFFPYKYKVVIPGTFDFTEASTVLRLGELYLIRAEARAEQNNLAGATEDLNAIRHRAGLNDIPAAMQPDILNAVVHERQTELFTEWGHRWLDLKRWDIADSVMTTVTAEKGGSWNTNWQLYPFPRTELQKNSHLEQNEGY
jgi:starch-binding outer membrane protein, SusD/RagB family